MKLAETVLRAVTMTGALIGVLSIVALMLLTVFTVVFRAVGIAFPGTYAVAELLLMPAISFSLAYAAYEGAHTRVELLTKVLPERARSLLEALMLALGTVFWVVIGYAGTLEAIKRGAQNERAPIIGTPVAPFRWLMVAAIALFCAVLIYQVAKLLRGETPQRSLETEVGS